MRPDRSVLAALLAASSLSLAACATLRDFIQPPTFEVSDRSPSQLRLVAPSLQRPLGGAQLRVWARVRNPNSVGLTVTRLAGNVLLEGTPAADVDLPLGLPLLAAGDTVIPLDVSIGFADVPNLARQIAAAVSGEAIPYALRGTVTVDAGPLGQPSFGPSTLLSGEVHVVR